MSQSKLQSFLEANVSTAIRFVVSWAVTLPTLAAFGYSGAASKALGTAAAYTASSILRNHLFRRAFNPQFLETKVLLMPSFLFHVTHDESFVRGLCVLAHNFFQTTLRNLKGPRSKVANRKHPLNSFFFGFSSVRAVRHKVREVSKLSSKSNPHAQMFRDHRFKDKQSRKVRLNRGRSFTSKKGQVPGSVLTRGKVFCNAGAAQLICHRPETARGSSHLVEKVVTKQAPFFGSQKYITSMGGFGSAIRGNAQSPNRYADQYCNNDRSPVGSISMIKRERAKHFVFLSCMSSKTDCATSVLAAGGDA
ncbi:DUF7220 family protein [Xanthomonas arboricola]|uniref:DUF7220 family protein n=1 Tax=Xanthomonas arboricola TaxID=56448 RepID=UPI000AC36D43|nr:hypothetical protein [Xanthomonas arboricola]MBB3849418.1 hypothetical protein [Xanthomonas arboricola]PPT51973.1 hypothetical protein XarjCFBP7652_00245 [Xanthomonas arboricola]CAD7382816.1 hypothetical protein X12_002710 [Xanthomonas arboricola]CAG2092421.1 hypothetical protein XCY_002713 [Xanthomonas arboricola pv. juglandis]